MNVNRIFITVLLSLCLCFCATRFLLAEEEDIDPHQRSAPALRVRQMFYHEYKKSWNEATPEEKKAFARDFKRLQQEERQQRLEREQALEKEQREYEARQRDKKQEMDKKKALKTKKELEKKKEAENRRKRLNKQLKDKLNRIKANRK